ncbi:MAG: four helix bundle protein [Anaerolineales bacterium]|nr:four helix bundle protein [Anaerolineales bacterium]
MTKKVLNYRDLKIWQKGIELVKAVYLLTREFPKHELYGLTSQLQRSAVSVPSNIAEGQTRNSTPDFRRFLFIAQASLSEVDTHIVIAQELGYVEKEKGKEIEAQILELRRMIYALLKSLPRK